MCAKGACPAELEFWYWRREWEDVEGRRPERKRLASSHKKRNTKKMRRG